MDHDTTGRILHACLWALTFTSVGCADVSYETETAGLEAALLDGLTARLSRLSTECPQRSFDGVLAEIGPDMEFPSEEVVGLIPPCPESPSPAVEVYFAGSSLIFDFRDMVGEAEFPAAQFDGYEVALRRECGDPVIAAVMVDSERSSVDVPAYRIESHLDVIELNLAGMAFDSNSFLKVDLEVASIECADF